jgi:hypothetical protein
MLTGGGALLIYILAPIIVAAILFTARVVYKSLRRGTAIHEAVVGKEATPTSDKIPSIIERFHAVDEHLVRQDGRLVTIESECLSNGGASLRDSVNRNETLTREVTEKVTGIVEAMEAHASADTAIWRQLTDNLLVISGGQELAAQTAIDVAKIVKASADIAAERVAERAVDVAADVKTEAVETAADVAQLAVDTATTLKKVALNTASDVAVVAVDTAADVKTEAGSTATDLATLTERVAAEVAKLLVETAAALKAENEAKALPEDAPLAGGGTIKARARLAAERVVHQAETE